MFKKFIKQVLGYFGVSVKPTFRRPIINKNKIIDLSIGKYSIKINRSHVLPFIINEFPECNKNLPRLVLFLKKYWHDLIVLDIGANVGDTVAFIKNEIDVPIICIEGNENYFSLLEKNVKQFNNVFAFKKYLGEKNEVERFEIETSKGTSGLHYKNDSSKSDMITIETLDTFITTAQFDANKIKVIKIDTDGFDLKILRGSLDHLRLIKPVLFFEYDPKMLMTFNEKGLDTLQILKDLDYDDVLFYDSFGRFIISQSLNNFLKIEQMHNYLLSNKTPFEYYDLCVFHKEHTALSRSFIYLEMKNKIINIV